MTTAVKRHHRQEVKRRRTPDALAARQKLSVPELAELWGVHWQKVLAWVRSGELKAMDGARKVGKKPRYLIDRAAIAEFERARSTPNGSVRKPARKRTPQK